MLLMMCVAACTAPSEGLIDASVTSDAGSPRTDGGTTTDAGARVDAGPPEPTFSSSVLFRDDFDAYADTFALRAAYPEIREVGGTIGLTRDGGNGALRIDYVVGPSCSAADVHVGKVVAGNVVTLVVTWRTLTPASFRACDDAGVADFALTRAGANTTLERLEGKWVVRVGATRFEQHLRLDTHAPVALDPTSWHRVTLALTRQSTPTTADGVVQVWVDGALVIDLVGATGTPPFSLATWPGALTNDLAQSRLIDDLALTTP